MTEANNVLCGEPRGPCLLAPPDGSDLRLIGTAVDYLIRAVLRPDALDKTVATGATSLISPDYRRAAATVEREAVAAIKAAGPAQNRLSRQKLTVVCRTCLVLARLEQFFRAGPWVSELVIEPLASGPTLAQYAERVVPSSCLDDLVAIAPAVIEDHEDLREANGLVLNPTFDLSVPLGGADADVIAAGVLWEFKATASSSQVVRRDVVWQLVGYALADQTDAFGIHSVGVSAIRRRRRVIWRLDRLLANLSPQPQRTLKQWRADFSEVVCGQIKG